MEISHPTNRVITRHRVTDPLLFRNWERKGVTKHLPYKIVDNFIDENQLSQLNDIVRKYDDDLTDARKYGRHEEVSWKFINSENDPIFDVFDKYIMRRILNVNQQHFNFDINAAIDTKYLRYNTGDKAGWHTDGPLAIEADREVGSEIVWRKMTVIIGLNDDYEGGELQLMTTTHPESCAHTVKLAGGSAIFFPPYYYHRVLPITNGIRRTLVYWMSGPRWA